MGLMTKRKKKKTSTMSKRAKTKGRRLMPPLPQDRLLLIYLFLNK